MTLLNVSGVSKQSEGNFQLKDISFSQRKFQKIAVAGQTGSGKSTLLKIIAGLVQPDAGEVLFENEKVKGPAEKLVPGHPLIAYLAQDFELPHSLRVEQVLEYSNRLSDENAAIVYEVCRISHLLTRRKDTLSGGEQQRIAIARLLIASPKLLLLDEPFSNLDRVHKNILRSVIHDIGKQLKITSILVSHDPADTLSWADKILVMKDGVIVQEGSPEKIYRKPADEYTARLFGKCNVITPVVLKALSRSIRVKANGRDMLFRPEDFTISVRRKHSIKGKVNKVNFYGSYYEAEVSLVDTVITVKIENQNVKKGDSVYVSLRSEPSF